MKELRNEKSIAVLMYLFTIGAIVITGCLSHEKMAETLKLIIYTIILISMILFYIKLNSFTLLENKHSYYIIIGSYAVSFLFCMLSFSFNISNLWMAAPILISLLVDIYLGMSLQLLFTFLLGMIKGASIEEVMGYFILGTIGCLLAQFMKDRKKIRFVFIIFICTNITLLFLGHNFHYKNAILMDIIYSIVSSIILMAAVYFIYQYYDKVSNTAETEEETTKLMETEYIETDNVKIKLRKKVNWRNFDITPWDKEKADEIIKLKDLMNEEHPLNTKLFEFSPKLYMRSELMGEICFAASEKINANASLAGVGAFYHKIGWIRSNQYIEEGIKLLEENNAPQRVIDIISQYHIKYGTPKSKEAAIVMLADSILTSIVVLEKKSLVPVSIDKLVDNVISLRFSKGSLDESELTLMELKLLQEFFTDNLEIMINQFKKED